MKRFIALDRPLAVFDVESTGLNPHSDRIVEISVLRLEPDGTRSTHTWRLNPTVPIPAETTAVHGITDEMVASAPTFAEKAAEIFAAFKGCDLGGFGLSKLDIPILDEEFARCGLHFNPEARRMFDALRVYHAREPRDLSAAMRFYCGEVHVGAHGAEADAAAALKVLEGEFEKYGDLPTDPEEFDRLLNPRDPSLVDREGRFKRVDGEIVVNFGKKKGRTLKEVVEADPSFLRWMIRGDFAHDTKRVALDALAEREKAAGGKPPQAAARPAGGGQRPRDDGRPRHDERRDRRKPEGGRETKAPAPTPPGFEGFAAALAAALGETAHERKRGQ